MATPPGEPRGGDFSGLPLISTAVGEMVVPVLLGVWADGHLDSAPWGLIGGAVVGVVGGFTHLVVVSRRRAKRAGG